MLLRSVAWVLHVLAIIPLAVFVLLLFGMTWCDQERGQNILNSLLATLGRRLSSDGAKKLLEAFLTHVHMEVRADQYCPLCKSSPVEDDEESTPAGRIFDEADREEIPPTHVIALGWQDGRCNVLLSNGFQFYRREDSPFWIHNGPADEVACAQQIGLDIDKWIKDYENAGGKPHFDDRVAKETA